MYDILKYGNIHPLYQQKYNGIDNATGTGSDNGSDTDNDNENDNYNDNDNIS